MSLIGYRNLDWLKARLLPSDMDLGNDYEDDLASIGLSVAAMFDAATGRELRRNTAARHECPADVESVVLRSYPVESITSVTLVQGAYSSAVTSSVQALHKASGIVDFGGTIGSHLDRLEIVSSGGYWCEDGDTLPTGATALPDDLLSAWVQQVRAICEAENTFRAKGAGAPEKKTGTAITLGDLTLLPGVRKVLQLHTRCP